MLKKNKKSKPPTKVAVRNDAATGRSTTKAVEQPITRLEFIQIVGEVIIALDVARSEYDRTSDFRRKLDDARDTLDTYQRRLVRNMFSDKTDEFKRLAGKVKKTNADLKAALDRVTGIADTLELIGKFLGAVEKVVGLVFPG